MEDKYQEQKDLAIGLIKSNCLYAAPELINNIDETLQELIDKWNKLVEKCEKNNYYMDFEYDFLRELINGK